VKQLRGASCAITGASGGIGRCVAESLAARGADLILLGRDRAALDRLAARTGGRILTGDLALADDLARMSGMLAELEPSVLVNVAGLGLAGRFAEQLPGDMARIVAVNLVAPMTLTRAVLPAMIGRRCGHVVNVGSIVGHTGHRGEAVYSASKAGLVAFTESLRQECRRHGVGVSLVTPGVVETPFFDRRGVPYDRRRPAPIDPHRVGEAVVKAIQLDRAEVIVPAWLSLAVRVRGAAPELYRLLASRFG
jgi:short-subunit dehydrogenase